MPSISRSIRLLPRHVLCSLLITVLWGASADVARALPDVVISQLSILPASPQAGDTVQLFAEMRNDGTAWTPTGVPVRAAVQVNGQTLGTLTAQTAAGQIQPIPPSLTYFGEFSSTWTAVQGVHQVCAVADDANQFVESNETNNSTCLQLTVGAPPQPDLVIEHLSMTPNQPQIGDAVALWPRIRNVGPVRTPIGVPVKVEVLVDGASQGSFVVLSGGQSTTLGPQQSYVGRPPSDWIVTPGSHQICAVADPISAIAEANEANNSHCISVSPGGWADLEITHISWTPQQPVAGETITFEATVRNRGQQTTPVGVDVVSAGRVGSAESLGTFRVEDSGGQPFFLGVFQQHTGTLSGQWEAQEGNHLVCVEADSIGAISEPNESNNTRCVGVNVASPCQLRLGPEDFGTVNGPLMDPTATLAHYALYDGGCQDVTLTLEPGNYIFDSIPQSRGVNFGRGADTDLPTAAHLTVQFEAGDYFFNHELLFTAFGADRDLIIRGAGQDQTKLRFCSDPSQCACVITSEKEGTPSASGSCGSDIGWSMLHFRGDARRVVIEDLSVLGVRHDLPGDTTWEFGVGIGLCYDASDCDDITIRRVTVEGARVAVLANNTSHLALLDSRLAEHEVGYQSGVTPNDQVLIYNNVIENQDKAEGTKYGIFGVTALVDSAIVGNTIANVEARGIYPPSGTDGLWISGNTLTNNGAFGNGSGINLGQPGINDVLVSNNLIQGVGDSAGPSQLGSMPIQAIDDQNAVEMGFPPYFSSGWPNAPWNGYGISVSGASTGAIGLVGNMIFGASSHGIKIMPGSSKVMVLRNSVFDSGLNGLSIVPGYAYHGEYWYLPRGSVNDVWVQGNTFNDSARAGIEILPRSRPVLEVPQECVTPDGCDHASQRYGYCQTPLLVGYPCVFPYDTGRCEGNQNPPPNRDYCFEAGWQSYRVDMHGNTTQGNTLANVAINGTRFPGSGIGAHFTLSDPTVDSNDPDNFYLPGSSGQVGLPSVCVQSAGTPSRSTNGVLSTYTDLLQRMQGLRFKLYRNNAWTEINLWDELGTTSADFDVSAPISCDTRTGGGSSGGGSGGERPGSGGSGSGTSSSLP